MPLYVHVHIATTPLFYHRWRFWRRKDWRRYQVLSHQRRRENWQDCQWICRKSGRVQKQIGQVLQMHLPVLPFHLMPKVLQEVLLQHVVRFDCSTLPVSTKLCSHTLYGYNIRCWPEWWWMDFLFSSWKHINFWRHQKSSNEWWKIFMCFSVEVLVVGINSRPTIASKGTSSRSSHFLTVKESTADWRLVKLVWMLLWKFENAMNIYSFWYFQIHCFNIFFSARQICSGNYGTSEE